MLALPVREVAEPNVTRERASRYVAPTAARAESGLVRRDDEDDRPGDAGGASWVDRIVIPDDLSELDAEVRALRRERRAQRRRARLRRLTGSGRTGAPLLLVALLLIAGVAGLLVMFQPRRTAGNVTPLGATQAADDRLPDASVRLVDGTTRRIRDFHPAVLALAPIGCRCDAKLTAAGIAAHRHNLAFYLVDRVLPPMPRGLDGTSTVRLVEPTGVVAERYDAERAGKRVDGGPVLVLVGRGGQVVQRLPRPSPRTLEDGLSMLVPEAAPAS